MSTTSLPQQKDDGSSAAERAANLLERDESRRVGRRRQLITSSYPYLFMLPALALVLLVFAFPIVDGIWTSLHARSPLITQRGEFVGVGIYEALFEREEFWNSMTRSLLFVSGSIFFGTVFAIYFALTLYYVPSLQRFFRTVSLIPWLVSGIAVAWVFRFLFNADVGLIGRITLLVGYDPGTWLGHPTRAIIVVILANVWYMVPFGTLLLLAGLQMLDKEMFEAADVDGATARQRFVYITLPQMRPHIGVVLVVFSFAAWNTFDLIMAMTAGGPRGATQVLGVYMYKRAFEGLNFAEGSAMMVIILLINVVLSVYYLLSVRRED